MLSGGEGGGAGSTLVFPNIRKLGPYFGVQNFGFQYLFQYLLFFGGGGGGRFQKNKYFGALQIGLYFGVLSLYFWVFLEVKVA